MEKFSVKNLNVTYNGKKGKKVHAIDDVSFELSAGDSLGIIGESGSGKSTMIHAFLRLLSPNTASISGQACFDKTDLLSCDEKQLRDLRWKEIAVVFQKSMNSLSQIHKIGTQFEDIYSVHNSSASRKEMNDTISNLFEIVNLSPHIYNMYPFELSGGMQQRLNIALSLMFHPSLLIMDEATTALDVITQGQIIDELLELEKQFSITRIMITHDLSVVASSCKKILVMYAGRLVEYGNTNDILRKPMHPYTEGLIHSFPSLYGKKEQLKSIPGSLPDLSREHPGCIFAPRCSYATEKCFQTRPKTYTLNDTHRVSCHKYGENSNE